MSKAISASRQSVKNAEHEPQTARRDAPCRTRRTPQTRSTATAISEAQSGKRGAAQSGSHSTHTAPRVLPNPSLKRSANGRPPGPVWRYAVHFRQPGPGVLPLSSA